MLLCSLPFQDTKYHIKIKFSHIWYLQYTQVIVTNIFKLFLSHSHLIFLIFLHKFITPTTHPCSSKKRERKEKTRTTSCQIFLGYRLGTTAAIWLKLAALSQCCIYLTKYTEITIKTSYQNIDMYRKIDHHPKISSNRFSRLYTNWIKIFVRWKSEVVPSNGILNKSDYRVYCIPTVHELENITQAKTEPI